MGLRATAGAISSGMLSLVRTRMEIFSLELAEEKTRLIKVLGLAFGALLFLALAVLVFSILVAVMFWPTDNRYLALGVLAAVYGLIGLGLFLALRRQLLDGPAPFAATVEELGRDAEALAGRRGSAGGQAGEPRPGPGRAREPRT